MRKSHLIAVFAGALALSGSLVHAEDLEAGKTLYVNNCQKCHGAKAQGGVGAKLAGDATKWEFSAFKNAVLNGVDDENKKLNNNAYNEFNETGLCKACNEKRDIADADECNTSVKEINLKLKQLRVVLYKNACVENKSACFWCTYEFDNQPCYIPKYEMDGVMNGYGSFCRPECAAAFLMKENIDDSTKFGPIEH